MTDFLEKIWKAGEFREIKIFGAGGNSLHGIFSSPSLAREQIQEYDGRRNLYITLNPCSPEKYRFAPDRLVPAIPGQCVSDTDIIAFNYVFIDIDPIRVLFRIYTLDDQEIVETQELISIIRSEFEERKIKLRVEKIKRNKDGSWHIESEDNIKYKLYQYGNCLEITRKGIPSTNEELQHAITRGARIKDDLYEVFKLIPYVEAESGNGTYLVYALDPSLPCTEENKTKLKALINAISYKYSDRRVEIDTKVYNPNRVLKILGTMSVKGKNTAERPHRRSNFLANDDATPLNPHIDGIINFCLPQEPSEPSPVAVEPKRELVNQSRYERVDLTNVDLRKLFEEKFGGDWHSQNEHLDCPFHNHTNGRSGGFVPRLGGGEVFVCGGDKACPAAQHCVDAISLLMMTENLDFMQSCEKLGIHIRHSANGKDGFVDLFPLPKEVDEDEENCFPLHVLPENWQRYSQQVAESICCKVDYIAMSLFGCGCNLIGTSRAVRIKRGWTVIPTIYWGGIGNISSGKTPSVEKGISLLSKISLELKKEYDKEKKDHRIKVIRHKADMSRWKKQAERGGATTDPPPEVEELKRKRVFTTDATVESLARILDANPKGLLLYNDELAGWVLRMNQYKGRGADKQFFLSTWSNQTVIVDRVGKEEPIELERPSLCIVGACPPEEILKFKSGTNDGFIERILWSFPRETKQEWSDTEIDYDLEQILLGEFRWLYSLQPIVEEDGSLSPVIVPVTQTAREMYIKWFNQTKDQKDEHTSPYLKGYWGKMDSNCLRFACALTVFHNREAVDYEIMSWAIDMAEYFKRNGLKVNDLLKLSRVEKKIREMIKWAKRKGLDTIKTRDLYQARVCGISNSKAAKRHLQYLVDLQFAAWTSKKKTAVKLSTATSFPEEED